MEHHQHLLEKIEKRYHEANKKLGIRQIETFPGSGRFRWGTSFVYTKNTYGCNEFFTLIKVTEDLLTELWITTKPANLQKYSDISYVFYLYIAYCDLFKKKALFEPTEWTDSYLPYKPLVRIEKKEHKFKENKSICAIGKTNQMLYPFKNYSPVLGNFWEYGMANPLDLETVNVDKVSRKEILKARRDPIIKAIKNKPPAYE